jgi:hypothetical protein
MKRTLIILLVLLAIVVTPLVPQFIDYVSVSIRKTGVVIDDETGQPMPNVIVIAAARESSGPVMFGPGGENLLYRVVTRTDSMGRYEIPSHWGWFIPVPPSSDPQYKWVVTVFQVGYAVLGDRLDREVFVFGNPTYEILRWWFLPATPSEAHMSKSTQSACTSQRWA